MVGAVFIDLSKALDTISHVKLLQKLKSHGLDGVKLSWYGDYLFNRSKTLSLDGKLSDEGSIIGPLLFVLFYNDFPSCFKHLKCVIYADDTVIYVPGKDMFIIESRLSADMERIMHWCTNNELMLNFKKGKTEAMLFGTSKRLLGQSDSLNISFAFQSVTCITTYRYLGVVLDGTLNLNSYNDMVYKKSTSRLRILYKLRPLINVHCANAIYQSMILPLLTYCGTLQLNITQTQRNRLFNFHRRAMN